MQRLASKTSAAGRTTPGAGGGPTSDPTQDLAPWKPSPGDPWDRRKAAHLLRRAGFGATPEELDATVAMGMDRAVDLLLTTPDKGLQEYGYQVLPHGEVLALSNDLLSQRAQWLWEAANGRYPLQEKMALFWHDHFSVGTVDTISNPLMIPHVNIFRRLGLGSFRQMLWEVTKDPAMLKYLDNWINGRPVRGVPKINENYGRELLELYTMGESSGRTYTQNDVIEASKVLSGVSLTGYNRYLYRNNYHVRGPKRFSATFQNKVIQRTTNFVQEVFDLIDMILDHPETARYVGRKIWEYFVAPNPDPKLIDLLASIWRESGYDIRSLMSVILRSNYFYSARAMRKLIKSPMEFVIGAIRNTGMTPIARYRTLTAEVTGMGLPLLRYTTPAGLEEGMAWMDSVSLIARANFANRLTQANPRANFRANFDPRREINRKNLKTAEEIVDHYLDLMVDGQAPSFVRFVLLVFLNRNDDGPAPFDRATQAEKDAKVRGLVHLILSLPEYQVN